AETTKEENVAAVTVSTEDSKPPASEIPQTSEDPPEAAIDDSKKDKKKKKNKSTKEEEKKAPTKKKPPIAAIRAQLEAQRIAEEERLRQEQEEQKRIEGNHYNEKKERLKKEGKYLNAAQKAKQQQAQRRLQQMIESGYKVEGLDKDGEQKTKKVIYSNKKKGQTKQISDKTEVDVSKLSVGNSSGTLENIEVEKKIDTNNDTKEENEEIENKSIEIKDNIREQWDESSSDEVDDGTSDYEKIPTNDVTSIEIPPVAPTKVDTSKKQEPTEDVNTDSTQKTIPAKFPTKQEPASASVKDAKSKAESESESDEPESEDNDEDSDEDSDNEKMTEHQKQRNKQKVEAAERRKKRYEEALANRSKDDLRSPICCILGHCFGKGTPVLMYDGRIKAVETIKEGDQVMGDDSTPRNVSGVTSGKGVLYKIVPINCRFAQPFVCNDAHILVLQMMSGPSLQSQCSKDGKALFRLVYFTHDSVTNLIQKKVKLYPFRSTDYSTINSAKQIAIRDLELLNRVEKLNLDDSNSRISTVRPGFIWQPTVTQFLNCDPEVQSQAKMFIPGKVRFPSQEGAFGKIVESMVDIPSSPAIIKLCAWLVGFWIGTNIVNKHRKCHFSDHGREIMSVYRISYSEYKAANRNLLFRLLQELDIFIYKDIPDIMMLDDIMQVRLPLLSGIICSFGESQDKIARMVKKDDPIIRKFVRLSRSCGFALFSYDSVSGTDRKGVTRSQKKEQYWRFEVEEIGIGDYYGFVVDGNHRFLLGDFTVTHNTKLLDKVRQTNVQEGEAGGITQQIGATYFPMETIKTKTAPLNKDGKQQYKLPGLLIIDTPGHESFTNLRSRGSSLCNIAILVVDIMHGLEPQTLESIRLLRDRKTPFIVALNKIDRIYDWNPIPDNAFQDSLEKQSATVKREFLDRVEQTILAFAEQGLNSCLYYENKNFAKNVSLVPTSAITGEGIPDMLMLLVNLTQTRMSDKLMYLSELECTVLEVKVIEGLGMTIDVVLSNGVLNEGDKIVLCGLNGPIVTTIRALLTPQPLRELRVKSAYVHHKSVKAALGVKISAQDLEKAVAGSRLLVCGPDDDEDELKEEVMSDLTSLLNSVDKSGRGVCVQASTLGSLEALLEFLKVSKIPVSGINIGPVHKKDIMRAATMLEKVRELAVILCFDVKVEKEAQELAKELGIKIFEADIIYHLFDQFTAYNKDIVEQRRKDQAPQAVFPCVLKIVPSAIFNKRDPIILGVDVVEGVLRTGTPICVVKTDPATKTREIISLGKVASMEQNHKAVDIIKKGRSGAGVAIKLECPGYETPKLFGRHFTESDELYSRISRQSINVLKESFRNDLSNEEWALVVKLKKILGID
ncbi:16786_t:CDS:10, partial [Cetraspora pellucida]